MTFSNLQVAKFLDLSTRNLFWLSQFKINKDHANVAYILTIAYFFINAIAKFDSFLDIL